MRTMKTYAEIVDSITLTPIIDEPTKQLIYDWFQFREVWDDEKFEATFNRQINRDYKAYLEMLRVQPGYAKYDWLVMNYNEHLIEKENSKEMILYNTGSSSQTGTTGTTATTQSDTTQTIGKDTTTVDASGQNDKTYDNDTTKTSKLGQVRNDQKTTTETPDNTTVSWDDNYGVNAQKNSPMDAGDIRLGSKSFTGDSRSMDTITPVGETSVVSAIGQQSGASRHETKNTGENVTTEFTIHNFDDGQDTETIDDHGVSTETNSNNSTTEMTYGNRTSANTVTDSTNVETEGTISSFSEGTSNESGNEVIKERYTGRTASPQTLMTEAVAFISSSIAWEWFYERLEPCFISIL